MKEIWSESYDVLLERFFENMVKDSINRFDPCWAVIGSSCFDSKGQLPEDLIRKHVGNERCF